MADLERDLAGTTDNMTEEERERAKGVSHSGTFHDCFDRDLSDGLRIFSTIPRSA